MRACFLVKLGIIFIKLPEFRRAQFGTSFLIANYDTEYCLRRRKQYTLSPSRGRGDGSYRPTSTQSYKGWPPRIPTNLGPKHLLFLVEHFLLFVSATHQTSTKNYLNYIQVTTIPYIYPSTYYENIFILSCKYPKKHQGLLPTKIVFWIGNNKWLLLVVWDGKWMFWNS